MKLTYAVVWREGTGPAYTGKLELGPTALRMEGVGLGARVSVATLLYEELSAVKIGRAAEERIRGDRTLVLERRSKPPLYVASLDGLGVVHELADRIAELVASEAAVVNRIVVTVPLRAGTREKARKLLEGGPPFDPEGMPLERHHVFLTDREAIFLFEGPKARELVERLVGDPAVWKTAVAWRSCVAGPPRLAEEAYSWVRAGA